MANETYINVGEAQVYFDGKLHEYAWSHASSQDKLKSLIAATRIIDHLNFKGYKKPVFDLMYPNGYTTILTTCPTYDQIRAAEVSQVLEFPRNTDTEVPEDIKIACCEIAYALLDEVDPDLELENLDVISQGYASVRTTYSRSHNPIDHLSAGVPSATAWRYLKPYLRDPGGLRLSRV